MSGALTPEAIIAKLGMQPHPKGGHYVELWRDPPPAGGRGRASLIHFLLRAGEVSHWHAVDAPEIWIWQAGAPLELSIAETGQAGEVLRLGPDFMAGDRFRAWCRRGTGRRPQPGRLDPGQLRRRPRLPLRRLHPGPAGLAAGAGEGLTLSLIFFECHPRESGISVRSWRREIPAFRGNDDKENARLLHPRLC